MVQLLETRANAIIYILKLCLKTLFYKSKILVTYANSVYKF